jgi:multiple antibiotic resistance protein
MRLELTTYSMASCRSSQLSYARVARREYMPLIGLSSTSPRLPGAWGGHAPHMEATLAVFSAEFIKATVSLFVITSPPGCVPLFLSMTARDDQNKRRRTALYAAITTGVALIVAAFAGEALFRFFGITVDAFLIAGAVLLFLYSMDMVQMRTPRMKTTDEEVQQGMEQEQVGVVPLGIPMLAGPGAFATSMLLSLQVREEPVRIWALVAAIVTIGLIVWAVLRLAVRLQGFLGPVGMGILIRIEGLILAAIAVQMAVKGIQGIFGLAPHAIA